MTKWFLQFQGQVQGPYSDENLESALQQMGDQNKESTLVWKRGLTEWIKSTKWKTDGVINTFIPNEATTAPTKIPITAIPTSASPDLEKTFSGTTINTLYKVQLNFVDQPSMTKVELMAFIAKLKDISALSIQNPRTKEWADVYAFPDIVERLGLSRRKHLRVPILANFAGLTGTNAPVNVKVVTISEGGMGFTEVFNLKIGDTVEGQISSPHFFQPLHVKAEVIYSGLDGYIGLKFSQINDEAKSSIIDYAKKFGKASS